MKKETRTVVYDQELGIEAYRLEGIVQPFPNHFHEHYVIGFVEAGQRVLSCQNREFVVGRGSILLFNPGDNHACVQSDGGDLDYRGFNISRQVMLELAEEITGKRELPAFSPIRRRFWGLPWENSCRRLWERMYMTGPESAIWESSNFRCRS